MTLLLSLLFASVAAAAAAANDGGLEVEVVRSSFVVGCERRSKDGDLLTVHYVGKLTADGSTFDSSFGGEPFRFQLGRGQVIAGWEHGLRDMCAGEKRILSVPSHLAYGQNGAGESVPPNSDLRFEVELLRVEDDPGVTRAPGTSTDDIFEAIDADSDGQLSREEVGSYLANQIPDGVSIEQPFDKAKMVDEIFQHEDRDKNGFIARDEFDSESPSHDEL